MACGAGLFFTALSGAILTVSVLKISRVTQIAFDKVCQRAASLFFPLLRGGIFSIVQPVSCFSSHF